MAMVRIPDEGRTLRSKPAMIEQLARIGIDYETWEPSRHTAADAPAEEILAAYSEDIDHIKRTYAYATADVISMNPHTPNLDAMLAQFSREHWHNEDEVRCVLEGRGILHVRPRKGSVVAIEIEAGDFIRVPRETWHWFDLCRDRHIRAIRLFGEPREENPQYTESKQETLFDPVCLGPAYI